MAVQIADEPTSHCMTIHPLEGTSTTSLSLRWCVKIDAYDEIGVSGRIQREDIGGFILMGISRGVKLSADFFDQGLRSIPVRWTSMSAPPSPLRYLAQYAATTTTYIQD